MDNGLPEGNPSKSDDVLHFAKKWNCLVLLYGKPYHDAFVYKSKDKFVSFRWSRISLNASNVMRQI